MEHSSENVAFDLKEILSNNNYVIPIYQRNYAWGKAEISQLINDVFEFFDVDIEYNERKTYYLGSLVCFKRQDGSFELIDGQQRHTTITLINLVLKNWKGTSIVTVPSSNLKFDSRKNAQRYIEELYSSSNFLNRLEERNVLGVDNFKTAINIIQEELREKNVELFAKYFYNNIKLFRVEVPQDTDLNHYFEIMNNRGEQLEKHEIIKASLMGKIKNDNKKLEDKEQETFAVIWDACSDMSNYVYFSFSADTRQKTFDNEGNILVEIDGFSKISIVENGDNYEEKLLIKIINDDLLASSFIQDEKPQKENYRSIIDFPNFLLQVLKIKMKIISLDDKKLLEHFNNLENKIDPKQFIYELLSYRVIFDKYIIKQDLSDADESKQNWGIRKLNISFEDTIKTFESDEELVKLQTMLYYSNSANTNNNWLQEILSNEYFRSDDYQDKVFEISKNRFDNTKLTYPEITIFNFYFIDFLLWKTYKKEVQNIENLSEPTEESSLLEKLKFRIFKQKGMFNNFKFRQLSSKEHLFPQSKVNEETEGVLNNLGNLCLISVSQNSEGNKEHPKYKRERFRVDNLSLKRLVMFDSFKNDDWKSEQINSHQQEILCLIDKYI